MTKPVAIVTGASRGVGRAVAILLAKKGWNLTLTCSSSLEEAQKVAKECNDLDAETLVLTADVSDESKCQETVQKTIDKWKRLDTLVNNAGRTVFNAHENLAGLSSEDFVEIYKTNTVGPYMMIKEAEEFLRQSPNASIVNIASIAGVIGVGSSIAYVASKGALVMMTKSLAKALGPIRINAICPGFIEGEWLKTGLGDETYEATKSFIESSTPLSMVCNPEKVAKGVWFFIEDAVATTGETLILDGGFHLK
ncbi:MAG: SDR family NAD(P)-dependent oxidoreductase [Gammaproteobacteria bacterium]